MRWNDWAAVGSVGALITLFSWIMILAIVALLDIGGTGVAFRPFGWPLWLALTLGLLGSLALWLFDQAIMGID